MSHAEPARATTPFTDSPVERIRSSRALQAPNRVALLLLALVVVSSLLTLAFTAQPVLAAIPLVAAAVVTAVWMQPLRRTVTLVLIGQFLFFSPSVGTDGQPLASGPLWQYFMNPGFNLFNQYLNRLTGINALSISLQEAVYIAFIGLIAIRVLRDDSIDREGRTPTANVLLAFLALEFVGVLALEVWGAATGGNVRSSLFQIRTFLWLPLQTVVLGYAFRNTDDFRKLAIIATVCAALKVAFGWFFIWHDAWRLGLDPEYMTGHHDTLLFVIVLFAWLVAWIHLRTWKSLVGAIAVAIWIGLGIYINSRRIAYVSLAGAFIVYGFMVSTRAKQRILLLGLCAIPFLIVYLLLARSHTTGIFAPGAQLWGMTKLSDPSSMWRELENQNLIYTMQGHRIVGEGWGKEYIEIAKLPDISRFMPQYRLTPHNSILWMLGIGGVVGFTLIWLPLVVGVFLAARSYRFARTPMERIASLTALCVIVCWVNQAWGDMGATGSLPTILLACGLALAGKVARETGAWPADVRIVSGGSPRSGDRVLQ